MVKSGLKPESWIPVKSISLPGDNVGGNHDKVNMCLARGLPNPDVTSHPSPHGPKGKYMHRKMSWQLTKQNFSAD